MARPEKLSPAQLLKALSLSAAVKPSSLAKTLGVARATVHRKLESLLDEGLAVREGEGPTAAYRLPTAQEALARAEALRPDGLVRMVVDRRTAYAVRESLELYARLGIGQLEEIRQEVSMDSAGRFLPHQRLEQLSQYLAAFKRHVLGLESNASFGIYNPKVAPSVAKAWAVMRALRHRLAWDQTPQGSLGVWHDEPLMDQDSMAGLSVLSDTPGEDGKPTRYLLELPREAVVLIGHAANVALRVRIRDFQVLLDLVAEGTLRHIREEAPSVEGLEAGKALVAAMANSLKEEGEELSRDVALAESEVRLLRLVKGCEAFARSADKVTVDFEGDGCLELAPVVDSPVAFTVDALPEGMLLNFKGGQYRVIAPRGEDELLTIIAESRSLQTAVQMARNAASGGPARQWAM